VNGDDRGSEREAVWSLARGVRLDLVIAVCALLISTLATGASWWQARVMQTQTLVLQDQLGAQVWPYVGVSEDLDGETNTARISVENDGLGPAVLRSMSATVDGVPKAGFIEVLHAILGPNLIARRPHREKMHLDLSNSGVGSVLRPGISTVAFGLTSKTFARAFVRAYPRLSISLCYCAILPGKCWQSVSNSSQDPKPIATCPEKTNDLLHQSPADFLNNEF
jgi:hypothetical protein